MRPLDFLGRIKVKLGIVIVLAVVAAFVVNEVGINSGLSRDLRIAIAVVLALIMVQLLARGMIRPLREMAAAAQTIAKGRYGLRVSATSRDEVGELARAFNAMAADLAEVDRQRRELVANVSHELRTPITGVQAVLENIVDGVTPPDLDTLGTALAQTQRLGRLVAQLLDLSRLDSGARLIEPEELDLASLCRQAVSEATLARDDVTVVSAVGPGTVLSADGALLAQVLANLLDNAVRHSPSGGTVRVEARPSGANLEISVVDDGPGIPQVERARVFERFSRLDAGRAADAGGAGLGLAIAKEIVELHGGSIAVSDPAPAIRRAARRGRETTPGCRMVVVLPLRGESAAGESTAGESTAGESADGPVHAGKGDMDVREPGAGRAEGRPGERGPSRDEGAGLAGPADALAPAKRPEETGDEAVRGEDVRGEEAGGSSPGTPDGGEQAEAGQGELADQPDAAVQDTNAAAGLRAPHTPASDTLASNALASNAVASHALASNPAYDRAGQLARAALGTGVGMFAGLFIGMAVSVILGLDTVVVLLFVVGGTIAGASRGSSWAHRPTPAGAPPSPWQGAVPSHMPVTPPPPAYVPPPLFPRPELPDAPRWLLPAAAAAGLVAAVALPDASPGLGFVLTAVAMGAAAFPVVLPLRRGRITPWTVAFGLLAYALVSVALFRDADWLVGPVLLAAFGVGSLAVSGGGRGWLAVIKGGVSVVFALLPLPWFLAGPLRRLKRRRMLPTLVSALVTVVLLAVFGLLFSSADAVFSAFLSDLLRTPDWVRSLPYRIFVFCVFAGLAAAAVLVGLRPVAEPAAPDLRMSLGRQVWVIPLLGLNVLFAAFVTVQITVLFGGSRRVLTTAGLTYAEYARSGFFELVTVSLFVLGIVAAAVALLRRESRADRWLLAVLLGLLCAFTLVILASALHRLGLYTDAYGLSRLRASVEATIWWLGAVFVLVLAVGAVRLAGGGTSWFFRALVLLTGVSLLAFAVWDPDARVAETQLAVRGVERLDHGYLSELGAEAVPILDRLPEPDRSCVLSDVVAFNDLWRPDPWNGWNLARARAREVLERRPVVPPVSRSRDCPGFSRLSGPYD
ncbi:DUF4153 domain-containing protein [Microbispora rosea]|uniref:DUF4153 domain-containing protein n=1 Tax=Microbispora rosea TaxID=58117 RepID=UPI00055F51CD|nr:DUF4153 domain-containing protein [Microbispora rosea]